MYIQLPPMTGFCAVCKEPVPMTRNSLKLRKLCGKLRCVSDYMTRLNRERYERIQGMEGTGHIRPN